MIRHHEAEVLIFTFAADSSELPAVWRERLLKLAALFAKEHVRDWNGLTLDSLRTALKDEGLYEYLRLIEPFEIIDGPDDFAIALAPPLPSIWQRMLDKMRVVTGTA
ncbi:MAG: hypothetical protein WAX57_03100 [Minisyncoccia bacterium]